MIEQGLKERLVGAIVLTLLGVVFIPLFLDGPEATSADGSSRTLVLPEVAPVEVRKAPGTRPDARNPATPPSRPLKEDKRASSGSAKAVPADPMSAWAVQVGSFSSQDNAERLRDALKSRGYRAFVTRLSGDEKILFRVRVGPEQQRERAELLAERLKKEGQEANVVSHP